MLISEIFKPQNIKVDIESEEKEELFEEIVNFFLEAEDFDNREELLEKLWERERKMTTGIAPHIAIPHVKIKNIPHTLGVLGISRTGIDYDSLDGKPVHLIMLLIGHEDKPNEHLQVLKNIASLLNNPDFYEQIMQKDSAAAINETIIEFEELLKYAEEKKE
jgi:PTS system fructose-specific IIC component/PTS system nitrogen regulatory IIA component